MCISLIWGKNDHLADIYNAEIVELENAQCESTVLSCLYLKKMGNLKLLMRTMKMTMMTMRKTPEFKYEEKLPVGIDSHMNLYEYENFCYTNIKVRIEEKKIFKTENRMLIFY